MKEIFYTGPEAAQFLFPDRQVAAGRKPFGEWLKQKKLMLPGA
jgi:hypothetical protein